MTTEDVEKFTQISENLHTATIAVTDLLAFLVEQVAVAEEKAAQADRRLGKATAALRAYTQAGQQAALALDSTAETPAEELTADVEGEPSEPHMGQWTEAPITTRPKEPPALPTPPRG